ncbi:MAG: putrescine transport system permease protein [Candidatus Azotimanducaceae bacterium]|jgi:putrescine transport system permease protein
MSHLFNNRFWVIAPPYAWLLLFFALPFLFIFKISFAESLLAMPPYSEIWSWADDGFEWLGSMNNYLFLLEDDLYYVAYFNSVRLALISTIVCLLIAYPMAYAIARMDEPYRSMFLLLVILPSWTSFLIRIYAWIGLLKNNGLVNHLLQSIGLIDEPIAMLHSDFAIYLGIVYGYLPFMILPIYTNLVKLDPSLIEAGYDLGARPWKVFVTIILPLSMGGVIAGCFLVFIPAVGEFIIPDLLGGPDTLMIGKVLWQEFFVNRDWPVASAIAVVMLGFLIIPIYFYRRIEMRQMGVDE